MYIFFPLIITGLATFFIRQLSTRPNARHPRCLVLNKPDKSNVYTGVASDKLIGLSQLPPVKLFQPKGNNATREFLKTCPVNR